MLIQHEQKQALNAFLKKLKLEKLPNNEVDDRTAKTEQILAYLENIHAQVRRLSKKRELVFIESGAGNCYLSYLIGYFYTFIEKRPVRIHCIDTSLRLMDKNRQVARDMGLESMHFHACDIADYHHEGPVDVVFSLHACDSATDKALYLGLKTEARHIFSVSCCQHTINKQLKRKPFTGMLRHRVFKEKLSYMVGDSLRALLLEMRGYKVDILEFVSTRYTDKNILLRAQKMQVSNLEKLEEEYMLLQKTFQVAPALERYLG